MYYATQKNDPSLGCQVLKFLASNFLIHKVEKILKSSLDSIPLPSYLMKIQMMDGKI
jgi:hypothetical protein